MTRLLFNPLFWAFAIIVTWLIVITMSIANNPEGARAQSLARIPAPAVSTPAVSTAAVNAAAVNAVQTPAF